MIDANTIRWGIIGCGDVTEVKSGPGFQKAAGSELVAVMRRDADKAADYARRHGVPRWYDDADALIADQAVNAVYIATPPSSHESYAHRVCAAGKPCYVEKPMARNTAEARRMVDAFAAAGVPLYVAYYRRVLPRFVKVKELIDGGALGKLHRAQYRHANSNMLKRDAKMPWRFDAEQAGGGLFLDVGSHAIDLLDYFLGPLNDITGRAWNAGKQYDVEDRVELAFTTAGVTGSATWDFTSSDRADEYRIIGDDGELRFSCFGNEAVAFRKSDGTTERFDLPNPPHVQQPLIQTVVEDFAAPSGTGWNLSTGVSALRTQEVMDAALQSFYGGREDGFWLRTPNRGT